MNRPSRNWNAARGSCFAYQAGCGVVSIYLIFLLPMDFMVIVPSAATS